VEAVCRDHVSGSAALARSALSALAASVQGVRDNRVRHAATLAGVRMLRAHPQLFALQNAVGAALLLVTEREIGAGPFAAECRRLSRAISAREQRAAVEAAALIKDGATVLTHSASGLVEAALKRACREGRRPRVLATESRPMLEGLGQARRLRKAGCRVVLMADSAAGLMVEQADLVLVGADALFAGGIVNKIGTRLIALAARAQGKPCYVAATSDKMAPPGVGPVAEHRKDPAELLADAAGLEVANYYFELTPWSLWAGVILEDGLFAPSAVRLRLEDEGPGVG
jgi:translation initiation factor eIF-2B subunit delta